MSRSAAATEEILEELSKFYGDDLDFAIINEVVRSNVDVPEEFIFDMLSEVAGRRYIRPQAAPIAPSQPIQPQIAFEPVALPEFQPVRGAARPVAQKHQAKPAPAKVNAPPIYKPQEQNVYEALDGDLKAKLKAPISSLWRAVSAEHEVPQHENKPDPNPFDYSRFEDVNPEQLEDVDPIGFEIEQHPELFTEAERPKAFDYELYAQEPPVSLPNNGGLAARRAQQLPAPRLVQPPLVLSSDDEEDLPPAVQSDPAPAPFRQPSLPSAHPSQEAPIFGLPPQPIDFYLPPPPASEQEAKMIQERLRSSVGGSTIRTSAGWTSSGEYAIAPGLAQLLASSKGAESSSSMQKPANTAQVSIKEFKLDENALDFLGQIFPDFDASYLADCLRAADNDVQKVSDFLLPVEMEEILLDENDDYDYSQHIYDGAMPEFEMPPDFEAQAPAVDFSQLTALSLQPQPSSSLEHPALAAGYHAEEAEEEGKGENDEEGDIPQEDAKFNKHFQTLLEFYPGVDPDLVMEALLSYDCDLDKAADFVASAIANQVANAGQEVASQANLPQGQVPQQGRRPHANNAPGRAPKNRKRERRQKQNAAAFHKTMPLPKPNAWARPLAGAAVPVSEFPSTEHIPAHLLPKGGAPIIIRPSAKPVPVDTQPVSLQRLRHNAEAHPQQYAQQLPDRPLPSYVSSFERAPSGNWANIMVQANDLFEKSFNGKHSAIQAYISGRGVVPIQNWRQSNESWMSLVEQAGREFYAQKIVRLDLHGLRLRPASKLIGAILQAHWEYGTTARQFEIVTGRGLHSVDGISRIKEDVRRQLAGYPHYWSNDGCVRVLLPRPQRAI